MKAKMGEDILTGLRAEAEYLRAVLRGENLGPSFIFHSTQKKALKGVERIIQEIESSRTRIAEREEEVRDLKAKLTVAEVALENISKSNIATHTEAGGMTELYTEAFDFVTQLNVTAESPEEATAKYKKIAGDIAKFLKEHGFSLD